MNCSSILKTLLVLKCKQNLLLEKKLKGATSELELKEVELGEILGKANVESVSIAPVKQRLEELVVAKNQAIHTLQQELSDIVAAHHEMVRAFDVKLQEKYIPREELSFEAVLPRQPEPAETIFRG